jgi:hypothetical protein
MWFDTSALSHWLARFAFDDVVFDALPSKMRMPCSNTSIAASSDTVKMGRHTFDGLKLFSLLLGITTVSGT